MKRGELVCPDSTHSEEISKAHTDECADVFVSEFAQ